MSGFQSDESGVDCEPLNSHRGRKAHPARTRCGAGGGCRAHSLGNGTDLNMRPHRQFLRACPTWVEKQTWLCPLWVESGHLNRRPLVASTNAPRSICPIERVAELQYQRSPVQLEQKCREMGGQNRTRREIGLVLKGYLPLGGRRVGALWYQGSGVQVPSIAPFANPSKVVLCRGPIQVSDWPDKR